MTLKTGEMAAENSALSHTQKLPFCILNIKKDSSFLKFQKQKKISIIIWNSLRLLCGFAYLLFINKYPTPQLFWWIYKN